MEFLRRSYWLPLRVAVLFSILTTLTIACTSADDPPRQPTSTSLATILTNPPATPTKVYTQFGTHCLDTLGNHPGFKAIVVRELTNPKPSSGRTEVGLDSITFYRTWTSDLRFGFSLEEPRKVSSRFYDIQITYSIEAGGKQKIARGWLNADTCKARLHDLNLNPLSTTP